MEGKKGGLFYLNAQPDLSENKRRGLVIDTDRFGLPLGLGDSSFAKPWTPGEKPRKDKKGKFENGPDDIEDDIK
jgi:hypothetical protein